MNFTFWCSLREWSVPSNPVKRTRVGVLSHHSASPTSPILKQGHSAVLGNLCWSSLTETDCCKSWPLPFTSLFSPLPTILHNPLQLTCAEQVLGQREEMLFPPPESFVISFISLMYIWFKSYFKGKKPESFAELQAFTSPPPTTVQTQINRNYLAVSSWLIWRHQLPIHSYY